MRATDVIARLRRINRTMLLETLKFLDTRRKGIFFDIKALHNNSKVNETTLARIVCDTLRHYHNNSCNLCLQSYVPIKITNPDEALNCATCGIPRHTCPSVQLNGFRKWVCDFCDKPSIPYAKFLVRKEPHPAIMEFNLDAKLQEPDRLSTESAENKQESLDSGTEIFSDAQEFHDPENDPTIDTLEVKSPPDTYSADGVEVNYTHVASDKIVQDGLIVQDSVTQMTSKTTEAVAVVTSQDVHGPVIKPPEINPPVDLDVHYPPVTSVTVDTSCGEIVQDGVIVKESDSQIPNTATIVSPDMAAADISQDAQGSETNSLVDLDVNSPSFIGTPVNEEFVQVPLAHAANVAANSTPDIVAAIDVLIATSRNTVDDDPGTDSLDTGAAVDVVKNISHDSTQITIPSSQTENSNLIMERQATHDSESETAETSTPHRPSSPSNTENSNTDSVTSHPTEEPTRAKKTPPSHPNDICPHFKKGTCWYGPRGGFGKDRCKRFHPKLCHRFMSNGVVSPWGCTRGNFCQFYHPTYFCRNSTVTLECYNKNCSYIHHDSCSRPHRLPHMRPHTSILKPRPQSSKPNSAQSLLRNQLIPTDPHHQSSSNQTNGFSTPPHTPSPHSSLYPPLPLSPESHTSSSSPTPPTSIVEKPTPQPKIHSLPVNSSSNIYPPLPIPARSPPVLDPFPTTAPAPLSSPPTCNTPQMSHPQPPVSIYENTENNQQNESLMQNPLNFLPVIPNYYPPPPPGFQALPRPLLFHPPPLPYHQLTMHHLPSQEKMMHQLVTILEDMKRRITALEQN